MMDPGGGAFFIAMPFFVMTFFLLIMGFMIFSIVTSAKNYRRNASSPILTEHAKVLAKRTEVSHHHHNNDNNHMHSSSTHYYVTFETDAGQRMELTLSGKEYGLLAEGDIGELIYQGEWFKQFKRDIY